MCILKKLNLIFLSILVVAFILNCVKREHSNPLDPKYVISGSGPVAPTLSIPVNGSIIANNKPLFDWSDVDRVGGYELLVTDSSGFMAIQQNSLTVSYYTASTSISDKKYFWKVRSQDGLGNWGGWSATWSFTIDTKGPAAPMLSSPTNRSIITDNKPSFEWNDVSDTNIYEFLVTQDNIVNHNLVTQTFIQESSLTSSGYMATQALADGKYDWKVRCRDKLGNWGEWSAVWSFIISTSSVTDIDGNKYHTVIIGDQVWMVENLKVTRYRNGDAIPNVTIDMDWSSLTTGAFCNYNNDTSNAVVYGRLYNWYAVNESRNIAPDGWHVPSDAEWQTLVDYLGGVSVAGGKMKEAGVAHWQSPNSDATNESGFSALPGGYRHGSSYFNGLGSAAYIWSSSIYGADAWGVHLINLTSVIYDGSNWVKNGFSIRLVRD